MPLVEPAKGAIPSRPCMNFDHLAAHYLWLENLFAGNLMQRCRTTFLNRAKNCRHALLVGEGPGSFLVELLRLNPQIHVTCIEQCAGMIQQARQRVAREQLDDSRILFQQTDVLNWTPPRAKFDLIVTHFFLDCFRAEQLQTLVPRLAGSASAEARWLLSDFRIPERGWRRWRAILILAALYGCFKVVTALSASWLTPPDNFLVEGGFKLAERRLVNFGFAHADLWQRKD